MGMGKSGFMGMSLSECILSIWKVVMPVIITDEIEMNRSQACHFCVCWWAAS